MYPPTRPSSLVPVSILLLSSATLSAVFSPFLPPSSSSSSCSMIMSSPPLSASPLRCELMITVTQSTLVYKLPLWFTRQLSLVAVSRAALLCLGCISSSSSPFLSVSHTMTPLWPSAQLSLVVQRPSWGKKKAVAQLFKSVLVCVNGGREVLLPATVMFKL